MTDYQAIKTTAGMALETAADTGGPAIKIVSMSLGDGNGNPVQPTAAQTSLAHEVDRINLNSLSQSRADATQWVAEAVFPADRGGYTVREVGLWTDGGVLFAVANFPDLYKPGPNEGTAGQLLITMNFQAQNSDNITITLDGSLQMASRDFVAQAVQEAVSAEESRATKALSDAQSGMGDNITQITNNIEQIAGNKVSRGGDTMSGSLFVTGTYSLNGGLATSPIGVQVDQAQLYTQLIKAGDGSISGTLTFRDAGGGYHNILTINQQGNLLSQQGNPFLEIGSQNGQPMRLEAFVALVDNGQRVTFPQGFTGNPVSIIVNALESDWDCAAEAGSWAADGFTMTSYAGNTAGKPQRVSVMAVGPAQ